MGNDLVYLPGWSRPDSKRHARFKNKLFTDKEQKLLMALPDYGEPLFWSAKESVYKILHRHTREHRFIPKQIELLDYKEVSGFIWCTLQSSSGSYLSRTEFLNDYVHTQALKQSDGTIFDDIQTSLQPIAHREDRFLEDDKGIKLVKVESDDDGIPFFSTDSTYKNKILSISHDHELMALAWI